MDWFLYDNGRRYNRVEAVLQLAPDSMLKFSLPYQSGLCYDNFFWFQIFFSFLNRVHFIGINLHGKQIQKISSTLSEEYSLNI